MSTYHYVVDHIGMQYLTFIILLFLTSAVYGQIPEYDKYHSVVKPDFESEEFIIWSGDTLNRRNQNGSKTGKWIEYKIDYHIQRSSYLDLDFDESQSQPEPTEVIDTISISYVIKGIGSYIDGIRIGKWANFYLNKTIKSEVNFVNGKIQGHTNIFYNKWPASIKYEGNIDPTVELTKFNFFSEDGTLIGTEIHNIYKLLRSIE